jgi:Uncharacterized conserved protein
LPRLDGETSYYAATGLHLKGIVSTLALNQRSESTRRAKPGDRLWSPFGIAADGKNLYVADTWNNSIRRIDAAAGTLATIAGFGSPGHEDGLGRGARFSHPFGIATDGENLYVTDYDTSLIRKVAIESGAVTTIAGSKGEGDSDGPGAEARFSHPSGVATDGGSLYVADTLNNKIRRIDIATGEVDTLAGSAAAGMSDGTGAQASFTWPCGIATDGQALYVTESRASRVRKIVIASGEVTTIAGSGKAGRTDGIGAAASFDYPEGIATDGARLYVSDTANGSIRAIDLETREVTTLAGSSARVLKDAEGVAAGFAWPTGIANSGDSLYVVDTNNNAIRIIK